MPTLRKSEGMCQAGNALPARIRADSTSNPEVFRGGQIRARHGCQTNACAEKLHTFATTAASILHGGQSSRRDGGSDMPHPRLQAEGGRCRVLAGRRSDSDSVRALAGSPRSTSETHPSATERLHELRMLRRDLIENEKRLFEILTVRRLARLLHHPIDLAAGC